MAIKNADYNGFGGGGLMLSAASPPLEKGDLGGFKKAPNPPYPPFAKGGEPQKKPRQCA
jgi:hypothetical protein